MHHVFLTALGPAHARWKAAFSDLELRTSLDDCASWDRASTYWLELAAFPVDLEEAAVTEIVAAGLSVVMLSAVPSESEAFHWLSLGAHGYCHVEAAPQQLREVAQVVAGGGLWMPTSLVQRLVASATRIPSQRTAAPRGIAEPLTPREEQVAELVGRGFSNREIAAELGVSERTVKANLTSIFGKLDLRDRVQLALYVNRLPFGGGHSE